MLNKYIPVVGVAEWPYYDERGLIVTDSKKCMRNYFTRGFLVDLIGTFPLKYVVLGLDSGVAGSSAATELDIYMKYAHLYLFTGYLNYIVDKPCVQRNHVLFWKWQFITFFAILWAGNFFFLRCYDIRLDESRYFLSATVRDITTCWDRGAVIRNVTHGDANYNVQWVVSIDLVVSLVFRMFEPEFTLYQLNLTFVWFVGLLLMFMGWLISIYSQTILMLNSQADTTVQHGVQELVAFLQEERVEKPTIQRCVAHYNYLWLRTKGVNTEELYKNIGAGNALSQDINFYIYKRAYEGVNMIFKGGEILERKLAGVVTERRFLPNEDIMRELDLLPFVFIVCRGRVAISRNGVHLATITTGGIFGQLSGVQARPVRVSARTSDYADVLEVSIADFQDVFSEEHKAILAKHRYDFIKLKREIKEIPSLNIEYMIRGIRILKLPFIMTDPVDIRTCKWYGTYLYFIWMWVTLAAVWLAAIVVIMPPEAINANYTLWITAINAFELMFLTYYITELFTMELVIVKNKIECRYLKWKRLYQWRFILDTISLVAPKMLYNYSSDYPVDLVRMIRCHVLVDFYRHFCKDYKNKYTPLLLKLMILFTILHLMACFWIVWTCNESSYNSRLFLEFSKTTPYILNSTDPSEWWPATTNITRGCIRTTPTYRKRKRRRYVIAKYWYGDYLMSMWNVATVLTKTKVFPFKRIQSARIARTVLVYLMEFCRFWISAVAITFVLTIFNELFAFERRIVTLMTYFKCNGLSQALLQSLSTYGKQLWKKQRGSSLPKFARMAPPCLKQDIFSSLYMHHLRTPMLFQALPEHFLRQLVVRLERKVVFPGNYIVQEGDLHPTLYFIHEGEVEKWCTDAKGETKMASVLTMNGYFGLVPALFPDTPFQYAFYSRTVVDLICLNHADWQDLLDAYPEVRAALYGSAKKYIHEIRHKDKTKLDAETAK